MKLEITLEKLNKLQEKLSVIDKYNIEVNTQNGYKKIKAIGITSPNSNKIIIKTKNFKLSGSPNHRVIKDGNWEFLKNLNFNDLILTKNSYEKIIEIEIDNNKEDLWDIEVEGSEYYSNGIVSHNSSLIESFEYSLYNCVKSGKNKKWATLASLPNRINGELLVKVKFISGGTNIEIERGISPNVLKLSENGVIDDRAGKSNINDKIEKYAGVDVETFKSFISMSVNNFKNFISLSNEEKQILLDKLFNLEIINLLNGILKELNKSNKSLILKHETEINTLGDSINSIKASIQKSLEREKEDIQGEIDTLKTEMLAKKADFELLREKTEKIKLKDKELKEELDKDREAYINIQNEVRSTQKGIDLFNSGKCPTCETSFEDEHFVSLLETLIEKKKSLESVKSEIESSITKTKERQKKLSEMSEETTKAFNDITYLMRNYKSQIDKLQLKSDSNKQSSTSVQEFENTIKELETKRDLGQEQVSSFKEKDIYYKELSRIFSDEGVKKSIISGIIKPINHFIEENVKHMGLPFQVQLDETFTADIRQFGISVEHDSLSLGETKKLNLCFLMAYLKLVRTKKEVNVLFLDEVFSSLDLESIESVLYLLKDFSSNYNINIFVVHHSIMNQEWFDRIIEIKKNVFSEIFYIK
jgi:DNA repair exonuclease SbcCD ATPase subunit